MQALLSRGDVLAGRYRLEERVGVGSYGTVWRATDELSHEALALKVLHPEYARLDSVLARFQREATAAMRLEHPAIPATRRLHRTPEAVFIAMDLVGGYTLERWLGSFPPGGTPPPICDVARLFERLASGVAHAHDRGVVHRDLKPQNIMIDPATLTPHILDFGLAKLLLDAQEDVADETTRGRQLGSYFFMAPEQIRGETCDARVDVFALGTILFELLTLRRPWTVDELGRWAPAYSAPVRAKGNLAPDVFARICTGPRPRPSLVRALSPALEEVVVSALAIDPRARPPHARALLEAFMHAMEQDVGTASTRVAPMPTASAEVSDTPAMLEPTRLSIVHGEPLEPTRLSISSGEPLKPTRLTLVPDDAPAPVSAALVTLPPRLAERTEAIEVAPSRWRRPQTLVAALVMVGLFGVLARLASAPAERPTAYPRLHQLLHDSRADVRLRERLIDALIGMIAVEVEDPAARSQLQARARAAASPYDEAAVRELIEALDAAHAAAP
jgi:serine/threonine protein kinase